MAHFAQKVFPYLPNLESLDLSGHSLNEAEIKILREKVLPCFPHLRSLNASHLYSIGTLMVKGVPTLNHADLQALHLSHSVSPQDMVLVAQEILPRFKSLKILDLSYNYMGDQGVKLLSEKGLLYCTNLHTLNLESNALSLKGNVIAGLGEAFQKIKKLCHLNLSDNEIDLEEFSIVSLYLRPLLSLNLSHVKIGPWQSFETLTLTVVPHLKNLESLNLSENPSWGNVPMDEGAGHSNLFKNLKTLVLSHTFNMIPEKGTEVLAQKVLPNLINLETFNFSHNRPSVEEVQELSQAFKSLHHLRTLNWSGNTDQSTLKLQAFLEYCLPCLRSLKRLELVENDNGVGAWRSYLHTMRIPFQSYGDKSVLAKHMRGAGVKKAPHLREAKIVFFQEHEE